MPLWHGLRIVHIWRPFSHSVTRDNAVGRHAAKVRTLKREKVEISDSEEGDKRVREEEQEFLEKKTCEKHARRSWVQIEDLRTLFLVAVEGYRVVDEHMRHTTKHWRGRGQGRCMRENRYVMDL